MLLLATDIGARLADVLASSSLLGLRADDSVIAHIKTTLIERTGQAKHAKPLLKLTEENAWRTIIQ